MGDEMQEQALEALKTNQAAVVEAVRRWAEAMERVVPEVPTPPLPDGLPNPQELVDRAFSFAAQVLDAQRDFMQQLLAVAPMPGKAERGTTSSGSAGTSKKSAS